MICCPKCRRETYFSTDSTAWCSYCSTSWKPTVAQVAPTIHLNGTSGASLIEQNRVTRVTLRTAIAALQEARPHARDYYPQGELAFGHAQHEHRSRMERLESVLHELEELGHELAKGTR